MSTDMDLDNAYDNRVKRKRKVRHTYPNKQPMPPPITRNRSFPPLEDESSEKCIIKEYSKDGLKKEIVISKRTKIHPSNKDTSNKGEDQDQDLDMELVARCLSMVARKIVRLLCYLGIITDCP